MNALDANTSFFTTRAVSSAAHAPYDLANAFTYLRGQRLYFSIFYCKLRIVLTLITAFTTIIFSKGIVSR